MCHAFDRDLATDATHVVPGNHIYHPKERVVLLSPSYAKRAQKHELVTEKLDYDKMPIIIASNRNEDGIMHGAMPIRQKNKNKLWSHNISCVANKSC